MYGCCSQLDPPRPSP